MLILHVLLLAATPLAYAATRAGKRGLVFVPNEQWPEDYKIWVQTGSALTWYYNYGDKPSPVFAGISQQHFEFVPMLWGAANGTSFLDSIRTQMDAGLNISHVIGFNEPDGPQQYGGSNLSPKAAAEIWVKNIAPLADRGVKLGLPACTGGWGGIPWLKQFLTSCSDIISAGGPKRDCTYDFVNIHWYGNFDGLASHMGSYSAA